MVTGGLVVVTQAMGRAAWGVGRSDEPKGQPAAPGCVGRLADMTVSIVR